MRLEQNRFERKYLCLVGINLLLTYWAIKPTRADEILNSFTDYPPFPPAVFVSYSQVLHDAKTCKRVSFLAHPNAMVGSDDLADQVQNLYATRYLSSTSYLGC